MSFAIRYWTCEYVEIYESARRHATSDEDIRYGVERALVAADDDDTGKALYLGPDRAGNLLEIVTALRDDGTEIVTHAMNMRRIYELLLGEIGERNG